MAFPPSQIQAVQGSRPVLRYQLTTFRNEDDPTGIVDITGYEFELVVRRQDTAAEMFRLDGAIITAASGIFGFTLTPYHTNLPAAAYDAELRWWFPPDAPTAAPGDALAGTGAGNVDNGLHTYKFTYVAGDGESDGSPISDGVTVADKTVNGKVAVSAIAVGPAGTVSRKLYRTVAGGAGDHKLVATISGNVTTTYEDNVADASLGAALAVAAAQDWVPFDAVSLTYLVLAGVGR